MKFNVRDLFWLTLVVALASEWYLHQSHLSEERDKYRGAWYSVRDRLGEYSSRDPFIIDNNGVVWWRLSANDWPSGNSGIGPPGSGSDVIIDP